MQWRIQKFWNGGRKQWRRKQYASGGKRMGIGGRKSPSEVHRRSPGKGPGGQSSPDTWNFSKTMRKFGQISRKILRVWHFALYLAQTVWCTSWRFKVAREHFWDLGAKLRIFYAFYTRKATCWNKLRPIGEGAIRNRHSREKNVSLCAALAAVMDTLLWLSATSLRKAMYVPAVRSLSGALRRKKSSRSIGCTSAYCVEAGTYFQSGERIRCCPPLTANVRVVSSDEYYLRANCAAVGNAIGASGAHAAYYSNSCVLRRWGGGTVSWAEGVVRFESFERFHSSKLNDRLPV